jgi:hypothetical protein
VWEGGAGIRENERDWLERGDEGVGGARGQGQVSGHMRSHIRGRGEVSGEVSSGEGFRV